jgi:hypothetical protein
MQMQQALILFLDFQGIVHNLEQSGVKRKKYLVLKQLCPAFLVQFKANTSLKTLALKRTTKQERKNLKIFLDISKNTAEHTLPASRSVSLVTRHLAQLKV